MQPRILIVYTGGTIGMTEDLSTGALVPFSFDHLMKNVPKIGRLGYALDHVELTPPIESSNMNPACWARIARVIADRYEDFDGFVVLHGTDTMAYTASALSFMLPGLAKPVVLTGSQLPIGEIREDGTENLITALQIAAARTEAGAPMVQEVTISFGRHLWRGNRATKVSSTNFGAFQSFNYPPLADMDLHIVFRERLLARPAAGGTLAPALANRLNHAHRRTGPYRKITGLEKLDKVINIDQSPIGRTPRSNPATYIGLWDDIRALFASTAEAKARGYAPGRFSFNVSGGRCEACKGDGQIKIEMHFLPDVYVPCEVCNGERYNRETLQVTYRGKNISEVLDMTVEDALHFFENIPGIKRKLQTLFDVGLGYIRLGQPATTLSGGEAQRVKLASELQKRQSGKTFYILDEPTTGLHFEDVRQLLEVLQRLVDAGNTVLVIEHNLDVIKCADHIVDLGPEGGDRGGTIVAQGTPEEVAEVEGSYTGHFVKRMLEADRQLASR